MLGFVNLFCVAFYQVADYFSMRVARLSYVKFRSVDMHSPVSGTCLLI